MVTSPKVSAIRNRLFLLLLRAFIIVVVFLSVFTLLTTGLVLSNPSKDNPLYRLPIISRLEAYYSGRGSWEGVNSIFENSLDLESAQWNEAILLDARNQIVVMHGRPATPFSDSIYHPSGRDTVIPIIVKGEVVGKLVISQNTPPVERRFTLRFLQPVLLASLLLAAFGVLIGLLLTRRVVNPLAEVIVAAEEIAGGNLRTRVKKTRGPNDLLDLIDSFNKMADALERNDRERRDMLADIAHELRTPLSVLRGRLEGILDGVYSADEKSISPALEETYILERIVEDLRLLALAETRQLPLEIKSVQMKNIVERALGLFAAQAAEREIILQNQAEADLPPVYADPQRLEQVIGNLIDNALRYSPEKSTITITLCRTEQGVEFAVSDEGPGVAEEELSLIFNRFWRSDKSRSRSTGGSGLGLAIAKQLIEAQGGRISARNLPGKGLQVSFILPFIRPQ